MRNGPQAHKRTHRVGNTRSTGRELRSERSPLSLVMDITCNRAHLIARATYLLTYLLLPTAREAALRARVGLAGRERVTVALHTQACHRLLSGLLLGHRADSAVSARDAALLGRLERLGLLARLGELKLFERSRRLFAATRTGGGCVSGAAKRRTHHRRRARERARRDRTLLGLTFVSG